MYPIPLNDVRAAAADVAADTAGTAVAVPVADIADAAADARAALAGTAADVAAGVDSRVTFTVALAASAAIATSTPPAPPARSRF